MKTVPNEAFYSRNKATFLKLFDIIVKKSAYVLENHFDPELAIIVIADGRDKFEKLINELTYIGGFKNDHTWYQLSSTVLLSMHKAMKEHGKTAEESGQIAYELADAFFNSIPRFLSRCGGKLFFQVYFKRLQKQSNDAQEQKYPYNWEFDVLKGDGTEYDFGIDYHKCFIYRFFTEQGEKELIPYMCRIDYIISNIFDWGLVRTQTICNGDKVCNFRYKKGRPTDEPTPE